MSSIRRLNRPSEREFLIALAINLYNQQYNTKLSTANCDVRSIQKNVLRDYGYEITTVRFDDYVRIRLYFSLGQETKFAKLRLENEQNYDASSALGDEIYVANGFVDHFYKAEGIYKFLWLTEDISRYSVILAEADGLPILSEQGEFIVEEGG